MKRIPRFNLLARICVVGVGGGGGSAVNRMIQDGVDGIDYIAVNTDTLALLLSEATTRVQIGSNGQGAGGQPALGRQAAQAAREQLTDLLRGADLVFVTAGMGGGTGSGAAPVVAEIARTLGALTVGVVTEPFAFEGAQRKHNAREGIAALKQHVHSLITVPNDRLLLLGEERLPTLHDSFREADRILRRAVQCVTEIVMQTGTINLDFADVRAIMSEGGAAVMSVGSGRGANALLDAALEAVHSDLLGITLDGARGILLNLRGSAAQLNLRGVSTAVELVRERAHPDVNLIFGVMEDNSLGDSVRVTLIATGLEFYVPAERARKTVEAIVAQTLPAPEPELPTRRVHLTRSLRRRSSDNTSAVSFNRFSTRQWGIPAYLRG